MGNIYKSKTDNLSSKPPSSGDLVVAKDVSTEPGIVAESSVLNESSNWKPAKPLETILPESSVSASSDLSSDIDETSTVHPSTTITDAGKSSTIPSSDPSPEQLPPTATLPNSVDEPQRSSITMSNPTEPESPIPIPKASYAIDWDNFDENTNPFQSRNRLGSSPPRDGIGKTIPGEDFNPFKPSRKLAQSPPPGEDKPERLSINNNEIESVSNAENASGNLDADVTNAVQNDKSLSNTDASDSSAGDTKAGAKILK